MTGFGHSSPTPVAKGYRGLFDVERVITALDRGAACKVDLSDGYDVFANKDRPLEEIRAELGIPPLRDFGEAELLHQAHAKDRAVAH